MRTFRLSLIVAVVVMSLCASGMVFAAGGTRGGSHSGSFSRGGGHSGSFSRGGSHSGSFSRGGSHSGSFSRSGGRTGGYYRGSHRSSHFNVVIGDPFWGVSWYYPYYYPYSYPYYYPYYYPYRYPYYSPYEPAVTVPSVPQEYIERNESGEPASAQSDVWYYCPGSKAYYPYVKECPGGWQTVPAEPQTDSGR